MKKYIDTPLIYNYSNIDKQTIHGLTNLYLNSKSKNVGNFKCTSCNYKGSLSIFKNNNLLFDNELLHHVVEHNHKPHREILQKLKKHNKIKIKATYHKDTNSHKFILNRNQILILDSLMATRKSYIDKKHKLRYSEHAGLLDFDQEGLNKILISAKTDRQDKDDPEILLPQNMKDAIDYEFMFHTHPPTPYPGARAKTGVLYEFPSINDIYHFIEHYNIGETQGSLIIAPEGMYIIHSKTGDDKINVNQTNDIFKTLVNGTFEIQQEAINIYGNEFKDNDKFYKIITDFKYINDFNKLLKKYLDDQIFIEYIPRKKDEDNNYIIDKLVIELKPIEKINSR